MQIWGVDFTSAPRKAKPIAVARARLQGDVLTVDAVEHLVDFAAFESFLARPGPWVAGFDFPFTQARRFLDGIGWPIDWGSCMDLVASLSRAEFRQRLENYKVNRAVGDKEHQRLFEKGTGAASPQKLFGVPVGLMFFEGAPRLRAAGLHLPGLHGGDRGRIAVEAYPGVAARALLGRVSYKSDTKDADGLLAARRALVAALIGPAGQDRFGMRVMLPDGLDQDSAGDALDAALCAVQAAWAFRMGFCETGMPNLPEPCEGWIADPFVASRLGQAGLARPDPKRSAKAGPTQS